MDCTPFGDPAQETWPEVDHFELIEGCLEGEWLELPRPPADHPFARRELRVGEYLQIIVDSYLSDEWLLWALGEDVTPAEARWKALSTLVEFIASIIAGYGPIQASRRPAVSAILRRTVFERDAYRCRECDSWLDLQVDHIIPIAKGGMTTIENLQTLCRSCNTRKGASL